MCEQCWFLEREINRLEKNLAMMKVDLQRARAIARKYSFVATEDDSIEGLVRNILTVLQSERNLKKKIKGTCQ